MKNQVIKQKPVICILGGMGPQASACLLKLLVDKVAIDFGARNDNDFPEIIVDSIPVPDFISDSKNVTKVKEELIKRVKLLDKFNPSCFAIACNTAHILLSELQQVTETPFVSIIDEVADKVRSRGFNKVGLLASPTTIATNLFGDRLSRLGIETVLPADGEIEIVEEIIRKVLAGKRSSLDGKLLATVADSLIKNGAEGIILGCTELPLIFPGEFNKPVFDSISILADGLLKRVREEVMINEL